MKHRDLGLCYTSTRTRGEISRVAHELTGTYPTGSLAHGKLELDFGTARALHPSRLSLRAGAYTKIGQIDFRGCRNRILFISG